MASVMRRRRVGFSISEVLVATLLLGLLTALAVPQYRRSVEITRANEAAGKVDAIAHALRMYAVDRGGLVTGNFTPACNTGACGTGGACSVIRCRNLPPEDWDALPYLYTLCPQGLPACSNPNPNRILVRARRKTPGNCPGCPNTTTDPSYSSWSYDARANGRVTPTGGAPAVP